MYLWETEVPTLTLKEWEVLRTTGSGEFVLEGDSFSWTLNEGSNTFGSSDPSALVLYEDST